MNFKNSQERLGKIIPIDSIVNNPLTEVLSPFDPENPLRKKWRKLWEKNTFSPHPIEPERLRNVKFGLITNLNAGRNKVDKYDRVIYENLIGHMGLVRESRTLKGLSDIVHEFKENGVNVIIINGGDGTLGCVATEVFYAYEDNMPAFFTLRGGTMNATAKAIGIPRAKNAMLLDRFVRLINAKQGGLIEQWMGTLRVSDPRMDRDHYGIIFGNGLAYEFDRYIYSLGGTSSLNSAMGFAMLNLHGLAGTPLGREVWRDAEAWAEIDGKEYCFDKFKILVCSTIYNLPLFLRPMPPPPPAKEMKFSFILNAMDTKEIFKRPIKLINNRYPHPENITGHASEIKIRYNGGFSLDGEMYAHNDDVEITIRAGIPLKMWTFESNTGLFW